MKIDNKIKEIEKEIERLENLKLETSSDCWLTSQMKINLFEAEIELKLLKQFQKEIREIQGELLRELITPNNKSKTFIETCEVEAKIKRIIKERFGEMK